MNTPIRSFAEFQYEVRSLKLLLLKLKFDRLAHQLRLLGKYNADQPRIPAGQTGGGQWTDGAGAGDGSPLGAVTSAISTILGTVESAVSFVLAGGFTKDQMNMSVQDFTSQVGLIEFSPANFLIPLFQMSSSWLIKEMPQLEAA